MCAVPCSCRNVTSIMPLSCCVAVLHRCVDCSVGLLSWVVGCSCIRLVAVEVTVNVDRQSIRLGVQNNIMTYVCCGWPMAVNLEVLLGRTCVSLLDVPQV